MEHAGPSCWDLSIMKVSVTTLSLLLVLERIDYRDKHLGAGYKACKVLDVISCPCSSFPEDYCPNLCKTKYCLW